ncbi:MAG TPA: BON domain-containing protein [Casimicrobiaceae bacterium]|nr:BON domain-containing protein [Casimicrobiaceae bacterium]
MKSHTSLPLAAIAIAVAILSAGCVPMLVAGAAGTAIVAVDRRSAGAQIDDATIETRVSQYARSRWGDGAHASVTSYNGVVLLSGEVPDEAAKNALADFTKSTDRVRAVHNELVVAPPSVIGSRTNDTYTTSVVKTRFVGTATRFSPMHVKVVTDRQVVYLMGIVRRDEADEAAQIAGTTKNVARVVKVFEYTD